MVWLIGTVSRCPVLRQTRNVLGVLHADVGTTHHSGNGSQNKVFDKSGYHVTVSANKVAMFSIQLTHEHDKSAKYQHAHA